MHVNGYLFKKVIGAGGFSIVCLVESQAYDQDFVAKVTLSKDGSECCDYEYLRSLCNNNIIAIYDNFEYQGYSILITEYCANGSMADLIKSGSVGKSDNLLLYYMQRMLMGLAYCHDHGIAHRDVKPANVLIDAHGRPKWIDFGLAVRCPPNTKLELYDGSPPYKAPELILMVPHDPFRADIWSLGVTFYEMATGELPWNPNMKKLMEKVILQGQFIIPDFVSSRIATLIKSMLSVEPRSRPTVKQILALSLFKNDAELKPPRSVNPRNFVLKLLSPKPLRAMTKNGPCSSRADGASSLARLRHVPV